MNVTRPSFVRDGSEVVQEMRRLQQTQEPLDVKFGESAALPDRPRRNRKSPIVREALRENFLSAAHFVLPLFIHDKEGDVPVVSLPGRSRLSLAGMMAEVEGAIADGVHMIEVFPAVDEHLKTADCAECINPEGLVQATSSIQ